MTAARRDLTCPMCGHELTLEGLFADEETREAVAQLLALGTRLGGRVLAYLALFHPPKNRLTLARKIKLASELLPDLQRGFVARNGSDWPAPPAAWATAIDQMLQLRDQGKLQLPLTGHGYLYAILAGAADKAARTQEAEREDQQKHRVVAASGPTSAAAAAAAALGGLDPAAAPPAAPAAPAPAVGRPPVPAPGSSPLVRQMREQLAASRAARDGTPTDPQEP